MDERNREVLKGMYESKAHTEVSKELNNLKDQQHDMEHTLNEIKCALGSLGKNSKRLETQGQLQQNQQLMTQNQKGSSHLAQQMESFRYQAQQQHEQTQHQLESCIHQAISALQEATLHIQSSNALNHMNQLIDQAQGQLKQMPPQEVQGVQETQIMQVQKEMQVSHNEFQGHQDNQGQHLS